MLELKAEIKSWGRREKTLRMWYGLATGSEDRMILTKKEMELCRVIPPFM